MSLIAIPVRSWFNALATEMADGFPDRIAISLLTAVTGFMAFEVWSDHGLVLQHDITIHQLTDIAIRIDHHLESIDSKYQDDAIAIQTLKGLLANDSEAIARLKDMVDENRTDRLRGLADLNERVTQLERALAPIRNGSSR